MTYQPFTAEGFGGLNLAADSEEVGASGAIDIKNVLLDRNGRVRTRPGTSLFASKADYFATSLGVLPTSNHLLVAWVGAVDSTVKAYNSSGTVLGTQVAATGGIAAIGTPTVSAAYFGSVFDGIYKWNGFAFSLPVTNVKPLLVAPVPYEPRLAAARTASQPSRVIFSDAGAPDTFTYSDAANPNTGNYIDLSPGDGEAISAIVPWRDLLFAFKRTKFFVFYGSTVDITGNAIFNYRPITAKVGGTGQYGTTAYDPATTAVAGRDGVYFVADDGVYRTAGDTPQKVSGALDPWFRGESLADATSLPAYTGDFAHASVSADARFVYVRAENQDVTFVFDPVTDSWTVYDLAINSAVAYSTANTSSNLTAFGTTGKVLVYGEAYTDDEGTAIDWLWQSGWYDLGSPERKATRETVLWGTGNPTLSVFTDHVSSDLYAGPVTLGTSPAVIEGRQRIARRGVFFSHKLSGSTPATVHRVTHHLPGAERPGADPS